MTEKGTGRVEAFSDGVFAIAITLLILEIHAPHLEAGATTATLFHELEHLWPSFLAFFLSFFVILIMWINHHELLRMVSGVDYKFLFANGFALLMVTFVPFPTAVLAEDLVTNAGNGAVVFYCATFFINSVAFNLLLASVAHKRRLIRPEIADKVLSRVRRTYFIGLLTYAVAPIVAYWSPTTGLVIVMALWLVWVNLCYRES